MLLIENLRTCWGKKQIYPLKICPFWITKFYKKCDYAMMGTPLAIFWNKTWVLWAHINHSKSVATHFRKNIVLSNEGLCILSKLQDVKVWGLKKIVAWQVCGAELLNKVRHKSKIIFFFQIFDTWQSYTVPHFKDLYFF